VRATNQGLIFFIVLLAATAAAQKGPAHRNQGDDFATEIQQLRDTWVQEFNAGHGDKWRPFMLPRRS